MVKTLTLKEALKTLSLPDVERNLFSSPRWLLVLDRTYQLKIFVKYLEEDGRVVSYIIYSVVNNFLEQKICICSYCDYLDCFINKPAHWQVFFESLREEYPMYRIAIRNLRDEAVRKNPNFQILSTEKFHILDLRKSLEATWKNTAESFRSPVKQAQNAGVVVRRCDKADLKKFYALHMRLRKNKYKLFPQPYRFFENVWQAYMEKDSGVLLGAYDAQGNFIGGTIYLICGNTLYYKFNTSDLTALKLRPNNILFWEGIKFAKERNLEYLDMGSSGCHQTGLIMYKNHTGAQSFDITHLGFTPLGYKFSQKIILSMMTRFCTLPWMPNIVLRIGSSLIYPFLA